MKEINRMDIKETIINKTDNISTEENREHIESQLYEIFAKYYK